MQQASFKGEDETCYFRESIFLYNNLKALERSLLNAQNKEAQWDLSNFDLNTPTVLAIEVLDGSNQILYVLPTAYDDKSKLLKGITDAVNAQGDFTASSSGDIIFISTTNINYLGLSLDLNIINPYAIKNITNTLGYEYSMITHNDVFFGSSAVYNPFDNFVWVYGLIPVSSPAISICDINNLTVQDFIGFEIGLRTFVPGQIPAPVINLFNKRIYCGGYDGSQYYITSIGADPLSIDYKQITALLQPIDSQSVLQASFYNPLNELMYFKITDGSGVSHILILDNADSVAKDLVLPFDAEHSFLTPNPPFTNAPFYSDYDRVSMHTFITTNKYVIVINGNPFSANYNIIIGEFLSPRSATHNFSSIIWFNGKFLVAMYDDTGSTTPTMEYVYEIDGNGNFTEVISGVGIININIANGYIVVNYRDVSNDIDGVLNKIVLYNFNYEEVSTIPTTRRTAYTISANQSDQTRLNYVIIGTPTLTILESTVENYFYNLEFNVPVGVTCFSQKEQDKLVFNLLGECGCSDSGEVGSFGDNVNILGDGLGNAIDGNGNYIQV